MRHLEGFYWIFPKKTGRWEIGYWEEMNRKTGTGWFRICGGDYDDGFEWEECSKHIFLGIAPEDEEVWEP
jgi:hypothetical protein